MLSIRLVNKMGLSTAVKLWTLTGSIPTQSLWLVYLHSCGTYYFTTIRRLKNSVSFTIYMYIILTFAWHYFFVVGHHLVTTHVLMLS